MMLLKCLDFAKKKKNVQYVHLTGFQIGTCNLGA